MDYDVVVIGAGPAGYVSAIKASKLGARVAIVEREHFGGTCLNKGCIPTKDFLKNVEIIKNIKKAKSRGIMISEQFEIDMAKIVEHKNRTVRALTGGVEILLKSNHIDIYRGEGKLLKDNEISIKYSDGNLECISAKKVILAMGSKVKLLPIAGIDSKFMYTSDTILDIERVPEHIVIIGGGVIGCEFSQVFANFGSKVTIVEAMDSIIPMADVEISSTLAKALKKDRIQIKCSLNVSEIVDYDEHAIVKLSDGNEIKCDAILLSVGRQSNLDAVEGLDIALDRGFIAVDEYMRASLENVYAIGDVNGLKMLAHAAFMMGEVAASNAMGQMIKCDLRHTPSVVYTIPEVAFIGKKEADLSTDIATEDLGIGKFNFMSNGRALASDERVGFIKVISDKRYGEILGMHMIGPCISEIINEASVIMQSELNIEELVNCIHSHPSFSEVLYEALLDTMGMAVHK